MNNKPDWKDAPEWAKYLAMDESGRWVWYEQQPYIGSQSGVWMCNGKYGFDDEIIPSWEKTLEARPS